MALRACPGGHSVFLDRLNARASTPRHRRFAQTATPLSRERKLGGMPV